MRNPKTETTNKKRKSKKTISPIAKRKTVKNQANKPTDLVITEPKSFFASVKSIVDSLIVKIKNLL